MFKEVDRKIILIFSYKKNSIKMNHSINGDKSSHSRTFIKDNNDHEEAMDIDTTNI